MKRTTGSTKSKGKSNIAKKGGNAAVNFAKIPVENLAWKVLDQRGVNLSCGGSTPIQYSLPHGKKPGEWMPEIPDAYWCQRGYHATYYPHRYQGCRVFLAELDGIVTRDAEKVCAKRIRLLTEVTPENCIDPAFLARIKYPFLSGADLSRANLSWANLSGADLSGANLSRANLSEANLSRANLSEANLSEANLSEANLSRANLSRANLYGANLSGADLSRANLSGADLYGAINIFPQWLPVGWKIEAGIVVRA